MTALELAQKIQEQAPKLEIDGSIYYIVELDRKIPANNLLTYAEKIIANIESSDEGPAGNGERLVGATVDGRLMRWEPGTCLTWAIDEPSFGGHPAALTKAQEVCTAATDDWNAAAEEQGIFDKISFVAVSADENPVFTFSYHSFQNNPNLLALAFFPNDPPAERVVYISPKALMEGIPYDNIGIIRHELGHVLGFRHEHIRHEAQEGMTDAQKARMEQWATGSIGGEALTEYDNQSVMHYPLNGYGTLEFELSEADKEGFGELYKMEYDHLKIREFPV